MAAIAEYLHLPLDKFKRTFTRQKDNRYALIERRLAENNNPCIFLKDNKCQVYPVRPKQCRTFPWWKENLNTRESWELAAKSCEGISEDAPLVPFGTINDALLDPR